MFDGPYVAGRKGNVTIRFEGGGHQRRKCPAANGGKSSIKLCYVRFANCTSLLLAPAIKTYDFGILVLGLVVVFLYGVFFRWRPIKMLGFKAQSEFD